MIKKEGIVNGVKKLLYFEVPIYIEKTENENKLTGNYDFVSKVIAQFRSEDVILRANELGDIEKNDGLVNFERGDCVLMILKLIKTKDGIIINQDEKRR